MSNLKVYVDSSPESRAVVRALEARKVKFKTFSLAPTGMKIPAIESSLGTIEGIEHISLYLLSDVHKFMRKEDLQPAQ